MNVHVSDALAKRLNDLAAASGRRPDELIQDALAGYLDEMTELRQRLDTRYNDLKAGRVQSMSGDEAATRLREKSQLRKSLPA